MSSVIANSAGLTYDTIKAADRVKSIFGTIQRENRKDKDPMDEETLVSQVEFLDKIVSVTEFDEFGVEFWLEADSDVCLNFYPPGRQAEFDSVYLVNEVLRLVSANVKDHLPDTAKRIVSERNVHASRHGRSLQSDLSRRGYDMITVRFFGAKTLVKSWETIVQHMVQEPLTRLAKARTSLGLHGLRELASMSNEVVQRWADG
jgi:hypothetical protein